jgi:hypothetical protein
MTQPSSGDDPVADKLADEITSARRRGLAELDLVTNRQHPLELTRLTELARRHAGDATGARIPLIRRLLDDGLTAWAVDQPDEATFVRELFFRPGSNLDIRVNPQVQLNKVRRERDLSEDQFDVRRRAAFRAFAVFLLQFVPPADPAPAEEAEVPDELQVPAPEPRRRVSTAIVVGAITVVAVIGLVIGLVVSNVGSDKSKSPSRASVTASGPAAPSGQVIKFDDLGGGSSIISVYPGVQAIERDKTPSGTFRSGDVVAAVCKAQGRTIHSDPSSGERQQSSNMWVRIQGSPGKLQFATLTYADIAARDLARRFRAFWCDWVS